MKEISYVGSMVKVPTTVGELISVVSRYDSNQAIKMLDPITHMYDENIYVNLVRILDNLRWFKTSCIVSDKIDDMWFYDSKWRNEKYKEHWSLVADCNRARALVYNKMFWWDEDKFGCPEPT